MNLFLSISVAYDVISCRKVAENAQILKIAKFPTSHITKKNGSLNRDLLKFLNRYERVKKITLGNQSTIT